MQVIQVLPSARWAVRLLALVTLCTCLCRSGVVWAAPPRTVAVNFQVDQQVAPDYLCVVAELVKNDASKPDAKAAPPPTAPGARPPTPTLLRSDAAELSLLGLTQERDKAGKAALYLDAFPPFCGQKGKERLCEALEGLKVANAAHESCTPPGEAESPPAAGAAVPSRPQREPCLPALALPSSSQAKLVCTVNTQPTVSRGKEAGNGSRVAVLVLDPADREDPPVLLSVALHGQVGVLQFDYAAGKTFVLSSAGGHYLAGATRAIAGDSTGFPLTQRCGRHRVVVPPSRDLPAKVCASVNWGDGIINRLLKLQASTADLEIPYSAAGGTRSVKVFGDSLVARFEWEGTRPPSDIHPGVVAMSVTWRVNCLHPWQACPTLALPETSATCQARASGNLCHYSCTSTRPFNLPVQAELTTNPAAEAVTKDAPRLTRKAPFPGDGDWEERWQDPIAYNGQTLSGYVDPAERHVGIDLRAWAGNNRALIDQAERNGEAIKAILVRTPYGEIYRIKVDKTQAWLRTPQVGCTDTLSYQVIGDLDYEEQPRSLEGGVLTVDRPSQHMLHVFSFGAAGGVGAQFSPAGFGDAKDRPYGVLEGVLTARIGARFWRSWRWHPNFELRGGGLVGVQWFESLRPAAGRSDALGSVTDSVWFAHIPISLNLVWNQTAPVQIGIGGGIDFGFPLYEDDARLAYSQTRPFLNLSAGWWLSRAIAIEAGLRVLPQKLFRYTFDYRAQPQAQSNGESVALFLFEGRMRFGF